jgi:hypothetical protein
VTAAKMDAELAMRRAAVAANSRRVTWAKYSKVSTAIGNTLTYTNLQCVSIL